MAFGVTELEEEHRGPVGSQMKRTQTGFSLIELLIVVAVILIITAIAVPNLLRSKILANESSAVSSIRNISTAEMTYQASWGSGFAPTLTQLGGAAPCTVATAAAACIIDPLLSVAPFTKSGYVFNGAGTLLLGGVLNGYELNATPGTVQVTGVRAFCANQTGLIQFVTPGVAAIGVAAGSCAAILNVPGTSGPIN
jgi:prepilin-type N-terminal cleavage/methylation domain-containing protein